MCSLQSRSFTVLMKLQSVSYDTSNMDIKVFYGNYLNTSISCYDIYTDEAQNKIIIIRRRNAM